MVYYLVLVFFIFFIFEYGFLGSFFYYLLSGFYSQLFVGVYQKYFGKNMFFLISIVMSAGIYHFIGYSSEIWCNIIFSGFFVFTILFSFFFCWCMYMRSNWSAGSNYYLLEGVSSWVFLGELYHYISTPLIMLLRVFMNFLIGQMGKWGIVSLFILNGGSFMIFLSLFFFCYEIMVLVLQSFIFVILSYELMNILYSHIYLS